MLYIITTVVLCVLTYLYMKKSPADRIESPADRIESLNAKIKEITAKYESLRTENRSLASKLAESEPLASKHKELALKYTALTAKHSKLVKQYERMSEFVESVTKVNELTSSIWNMQSLYFKHDAAVKKRKEIGGAINQCKPRDEHRLNLIYDKAVEAGQSAMDKLESARSSFRECSSVLSHIIG